MWIKIISFLLRLSLDLLRFLFQRASQIPLQFYRNSVQQQREGRGEAQKALIPTICRTCFLCLSILLFSHGFHRISSYGAVIILFMKGCSKVQKQRKSYESHTPFRENRLTGLGNIRVYCISARRGFRRHTPDINDINVKCVLDRVPIIFLKKKQDISIFPLKPGHWVKTG